MIKSKIRFNFVLDEEIRTFTDSKRKQVLEIKTCISIEDKVKMNKKYRKKERESRIKKKISLDIY